MDNGHMTEQILQLTLEILYLLTGEIHAIVNQARKSPKRIPGRAPLLNDKKVLTVTKKIIELLTGEVPIRSQDVAVYLSMEEREYLEEHQEIYKEAMTEEQTPERRKGTSKAPENSMDIKIQVATCPEGSASEVSLTNGITRVPKSPNHYRVTSNQTNLDCSKESPQPSFVEDDAAVNSTAEESATDSPAILLSELPPPLAEKDCAEKICMLPKQTQSSDPEVNMEANEVTRHGPVSDGQPSIRQPTYEKSNEGSQNPLQGITEETTLRSEDGPAPVDACLPSYSSQDSYKPAQTSPEPQTIMFTNIYAPVDLTQEELTNIKQELVTWEEESRSFQEIYLPGTHLQDTGAPPRGGGLQISATNVKVEHEEDNMRGYELQDEEQVDFINIHIGDDDEDDEDDEGAIDVGNLNRQSLFNYGHDGNFNTGHGYDVSQMCTCPVCQRSFSSSATLAKHQLICRGRKRHVCSRCGKCFASASYLVIHERIHTGERPFCCSHCGKGFSRKPDLVRHERIHTGERPFACPDCGKRFTSVSNIFMHRRIHTGVKPFPCIQCGKRFIKKSDLVRHERIHLPQRPVPCPECGRVFGSNQVLNKHMLSHAGALTLDVQGGS